MSQDGLRRSPGDCRTTAIASRPSRARTSSRSTRSAAASTRSSAARSGTDRENVVVRDSDPRVGDHSLFELHYTEWIGKPLDVASMRTRPIVARHAARHRRGGIGSRAAPARVVPPGMPENPRIVPMPSQGHRDRRRLAAPPRSRTRPPARPRQRRSRTSGEASARARAPGRRRADSPAQLPYPDRHVRYAEDVATLLRSIHRRDRIFDDVAHESQAARALDQLARCRREAARRDQSAQQVAATSGRARRGRAATGLRRARLAPRRRARGAHRASARRRTARAARRRRCPRVYQRENSPASSSR